MTTEGGDTRANYDLFIAIAVLFFVVLAALVIVTELPDYVFFYYVLASGITYLMYYADKTSERVEGHRISEKKLHLLAALGGWPGAMVAQQVLHHKSMNASFRKAFWVTVAVNCVLLLWLFTESGAAFLHRAVGTSL